MDTEDLVEMKQRLCSLFHKQCCNTTMFSKRKLILHFDLNKTIVPLDSATGETVEAALNVYLSGMAWGQDREGVWHCSKDKLSSVPLSDDDVSFYKFEEKRLLSHFARDRSVLRCHLTSFTDRPQGTYFKPYLNSLLDSLKWTLPYVESKHKEVTVPGTKSYRYHFILPAFYKLLNFLVKEDRDFAVIFRTYGCDAISVLNSIRTAISCKLPFCHNLNGLLDGVRRNVWVLTRSGEEGVFEFHSDSSKDRQSSGFTKTDNELYSAFSDLSGICAIKDDVSDWYDHNFDPKRGKPLWIDLSDNKNQHIFFDDNIRVGSSDSIVNVRVRETEENFRSVASVEEYKFMNTNIVPVTFSDAILDEDYFIQKLIQCEENYSRLVERTLG